MDPALAASLLNTEPGPASPPAAAPQQPPSNQPIAPNANNNRQLQPRRPNRPTRTNSHRSSSPTSSSVEDDHNANQSFNMNLGGPSGITISNGPHGSHMSMGGPNGINMSSGPGGSSLFNPMIGWNNNINSPITSNNGNSNGWPAQFGWNNNNNSPIVINRNNGLVNGRRPNGTSSNGLFMTGWNNNNPTYSGYDNNNNNINSPINGDPFSTNWSDDDYGRDMADAMMGSVNINNGVPWGYPGTTKKDRKNSWWRKR